MSKDNTELSKFSVSFGTLYYDGFEASSYRIKQYRKLTGGTSARARVPKEFTKYFSDDTKFMSRQGHVEPWARPMLPKGGKNPNYAWASSKAQNSYGEIRNVSGKWGVSLKRGETQTINGIKAWVTHIHVVLYQLGKQAENFRVFVGKRALKVFQNSFKYQKFYDKKSARWAPLSNFTLKKRFARGTGRTILREYGDLYRSLELNENAPPKKPMITTNVVSANLAHHKKHSICYAGLHNEGIGTYGNGFGKREPKHYIQRKFMGHSSYLDPFSDSFMSKMTKRYLFDSVFVIKKTK